jgi:hypothetical protein
MLNLRSQTLNKLELLSLPSEVSSVDIVLYIKEVQGLSDLFTHKTSNGISISTTQSGSFSFTFTTQDGVKHDATKWFIHKNYKMLLEVMTQAKEVGVARGIDAVLFDAFISIVGVFKTSHLDFIKYLSFDAHNSQGVSVVKFSSSNYVVASRKIYPDGEIDLTIYPIRASRDFNEYYTARSLRSSSDSGQSATDYAYKSLTSLDVVVDKVLNGIPKNRIGQDDVRKTNALLNVDYDYDYLIPTDYLDSLGIEYTYCIYSGRVVISNSSFNKFSITERIDRNTFGNILPTIGTLGLSHNAFYRHLEDVDCGDCGSSTEVFNSSFFHEVSDAIESEDDRDEFRDVITTRYTLSDDFNDYCHNCQDNHEYFSDTLSRHQIIVRGDMIVGHSGKEYNYYNGSGIDSYDYKPDFKLLHLQDESDSDLHLGAEIEIDKGGENHNKSRAITAILGSDSYAMHDGSLSDGFEIATMPASLNYHMNYMNYQDAFHAASKLGYRAHDTSTCGLHVHFNRRFFGSARATQNIKAAYMTLILERNWDEVVKFSRRDYHHIEEWADKRDLADEIHSSDTDDDITRKFFDRYDAKYVAVNTQHSNSFEIRIFRGTLRYETYIATLQFVSNLAHIAKECTTLTRAQQITFDDIVNYKRHPELINYLATRGMAVESDILPVLEPKPETPTLFDVVAA